MNKRVVVDAFNRLYSSVLKILRPFAHQKQLPFSMYRGYVNVEFEGSLGNVEGIKEC